MSSDHYRKVFHIKQFAFNHNEFLRPDKQIVKNVTLPCLPLEANAPVNGYPTVLIVLLDTFF